MSIQLPMKLLVNGNAVKVQKVIKGPSKEHFIKAGITGIFTPGRIFRVPTWAIARNIKVEVPRNDEFKDILHINPTP